MGSESRLSGIFYELKDHRINRTKLHSMENIIFISLAAIISGAETWNEIQEFGEERYEWLSKHLDLPNGIPSHDTFNRFFSGLDTSKFEECFRKWVSSLGIETAGDIISIDGKTIRGSKGHAQSAIHMVSAWSKNAGITLGQIKTAEKSNEITAIPELLDALFLEGTIVTIDAMGTQTDIADKIVESKADYVLAVKGNQKYLMNGIMDSFKRIAPERHVVEDFGHGRIEKRTYSVITDLKWIEMLDSWRDLKSIIRLDSEIHNKTTGVRTAETRYYISSLIDVRKIATAIRSHWGIENSLHWMLDVAFSEDRNRKKNENAVVNFSLMNKIALDMLKREPSLKLGVKSKRLKAAWSLSYLEKVLSI